MKKLYLLLACFAFIVGIFVNAIFVFAKENVVEIFCDNLYLITNEGNLVCDGYGRVEFEERLSYLVNIDNKLGESRYAIIDDDYNIYVLGNGNVKEFLNISNLKYTLGLGFYTYDNGIKDIIFSDNIFDNTKYALDNTGVSYLGEVCADLPNPTGCIENLALYIMDRYGDNWNIRLQKSISMNTMHMNKFQLRSDEGNCTLV